MKVWSTAGDLMALTHVYLLHCHPNTISPFTFFCTGRGVIQWDFVHGLLELAIYGGRVDNPFDTRVMVSYLAQFFNSNIISDQGRANRKLGPLRMPASTGYRVRVDISCHFVIVHLLVN